MGAQKLPLWLDALLANLAAADFAEGKAEEWQLSLLQTLDEILEAFRYWHSSGPLSLTAEPLLSPKAS